jgi:REP element-mobilizing transposase RayT
MQFFTATNLNWLCCLQNEYHKQIIIEAIRHRVKNNLLTVYAFVIMPNHIHCIWQIHDELSREEFQRDFMKFTARSILKFMHMNDDPVLQQLKVNAKDRQFQVWERNALSVDLFSENVFLQKLNYIHTNPLQPKWNLEITPESYYYSSAAFYETGKNDFDLLTIIKNEFVGLMLLDRRPTVAVESF